MRLTFLLGLGILAAACDSRLQSPVQPSPASSPASSPTPSPAPAVVLRVARIIEVGQTIAIPYLGWDDRDTFFRLTAPASGTLVLRVSWRVSPWDIGWYSVTYDNRAVTGDSEIVVTISAIEGRMYEFSVNNTWPWDPDPGFVLTTRME